MNTYVILRRNFWDSVEALEKSASISARIGSEEMADDVKWIRSYVTEEDGRLGTVCIYQATSLEAIHEHARRVGMPADEVFRVENLVVVNEDPVLIPQT
jgi:hypothetical protein